MKESIFLSASVPVIGRGEFYRTADPLLILSAVRAFASIVLGRRHIVWGGHPAITPMLMEVCKEIGVAYGDSVTLYQSRFFEEEFPEENAFFKNVVFTDNVEDNRDASLARMREQMLNHPDLKAAVFIGGMDGVEDESNFLKNFQPRSKQIFVASTGGAAQMLALRSGAQPEALNDIDYVSIFHKELGITSNEPRKTIESLPLIRKA